MTIFSISQKTLYMFDRERVKQMNKKDTFFECTLY